MNSVIMKIAHLEICEMVARAVLPGKCGFKHTEKIRLKNQLSKQKVMIKL